MVSKEIVLVTSNKNRYNFVKKAFAEFNIKVIRKSVKLNEIQADIVKEVAIRKALDCSKKINTPCVCEDTELTINTLSGFPGPYMKFVQSRLTTNQVIQLLKNQKDKSATFKSVLVYATPLGKIKLFETKVLCEIINFPRGTNGKGWDSIILIKKLNKTLAECNGEEKFDLWSEGYKKLGKWLAKKKNTR